MNGWPCLLPGRTGRHLKAATVTLFLALTLAACGGSGGHDISNAVGDAKGFGPTQLYDPDTNPGGHVLKEGDTGIIFLQQRAAASPAALRIWFDVANASTYGLEMEEEDLALLSRVHVTDADGRSMVAVDPAHRMASADLSPGRYALHLTGASNGNAESVPLFVRFEAQQVAAPGSASKAGFVEVLSTVFAKSCIACDLRGAHLALLLLYDADLSLAYLNGANLSQANLVRANLKNTTLSSANLEGANLENANLELASLRGANLRKANLRGANLRSVDLSEAQLEGATWVDGRICASSSPLGQCR
ncbi:pentapeptide repeat-containing protein [Ottowia thiooxydans]|uniref:Pentapeptide repeat-containing protein n=1 Tax=Ottowia thiooxydans TaxID=219182 RepID=A0ABV2QC18_9BURK